VLLSAFLRVAWICRNDVIRWCSRRPAGWRFPNQLLQCPVWIWWSRRQPLTAHSPSQHGSNASPQLEGYGKRVDFECFPPDPFIADPMQFAVVQATKWNRDFVTNLTAHRLRLGNPQVMGIDRPAAYQTRLSRDKFAKFRVSEATGFGNARTGSGPCFFLSDEADRPARWKPCWSAYCLIRRCSQTWMPLPR
jgi:hypothetical protein